MNLAYMLLPKVAVLASQARWFGFGVRNSGSIKTIRLILGFLNKPAFLS